MTRSLTTADLTALEADVVAALEAQDPSSLPVLGFGELSVALAWPTDEPRFACKRTPPFTPAQFNQYQALVDDYVGALREAGIGVIVTSVRSVESGDRLIGYLVQPLLAKESLGNNVLATSDPDPDHPFLAALGQAIATVSDKLSIDAQVTNWSWDDTELTLLDVGTPFMWNDDGTSRIDMKPFLPMIPALLRPLVRRDITALMRRWQEPRQTALDVVANLYREGMAEWVEPTLVAFNRVVGVDHPMMEAEAEALHREDLKTWPRLKRLQRVERTWQTRVRRRRYEFFIHTTFGGNTI
ncbi:MAG: hypothetical protein GY773_03930 [Actinomycetia bacterium]|nr:hypothetical protein [Actinomycetes bacterium]